MKIKRITKNDPVSRVSLSLHKSFQDKVEAYSDLYKETYGEELPLAALVEEVIGNFIDSDKAFKDHMSKPAASKPAAKKPATKKVAPAEEKPAEEKVEEPAKKGFFG